MSCGVMVFFSPCFALLPAQKATLTVDSSTSASLQLFQKSQNLTCVASVSAQTFLSNCVWGKLLSRDRKSGSGRNAAGSLAITGDALKTKKVNNNNNNNNKTKFREEAGTHVSMVEEQNLPTRVREMVNGYAENSPLGGMCMRGMCACRCFHNAFFLPHKKHTKMAITQGSGGNSLFPPSPFPTLCARDLASYRARKRG